jgi:hypothetical protein
MLLFLPCLLVHLHSARSTSLLSETFGRAVDRQAISPRTIGISSFESDHVSTQGSKRSRPYSHEKGRTVRGRRRPAASTVAATRSRIPGDHGLPGVSYSHLAIFQNFPARNGSPVSDSTYDKLSRRRAARNHHAAHPFALIRCHVSSRATEASFHPTDRAPDPSTLSDILSLHGAETSDTPCEASRTKDFAGPPAFP